VCLNRYGIALTACAFDFRFPYLGGGVDFFHTAVEAFEAFFEALRDELTTNYLTPYPGSTVRCPLDGVGTPTRLVVSVFQVYYVDYILFPIGVRGFLSYIPMTFP